MNPIEYITGFSPGRRSARRHAPRAHQRGQAMTEYAIIGGALAALLFAATSPAGKALAQAIHDFYLNLTFFLSLP